MSSYHAVYNLVVESQNNDPFVWAGIMVAGLLALGYVDAANNVKDWIAQGKAKGQTTSGIQYKKRHNEAVFPSEQVFCNQKTGAHRPLTQVAKAVATALTENVLYNPDRFNDKLTIAGLKQGLTQHNRDEKRQEKAALSQAIAGKQLSGKQAQEIVKISAGLSETASNEKRREHEQFVDQALKMIDKLNKVAPNTVPASSRVRVSRD